MKKINFKYWGYQFLGWGIFCLILIYFNFIVFKEQFDQHGGNKEFLCSLFFFFISGILSTHLLRLIISKTGWLKFSINKFFSVFILGIVATALFMFFCVKILEKSTPFSFDKFINNYKLNKAKKAEQDAGLDKVTYFNNPILKDSIIIKSISDIRKNYGWYKDVNGKWKYEDKTFLVEIYQNIILIALWVLLYIVYHYVEKNRRDKIDRLKLENTVKELELKTIKSHINPHFIFNSLNSIRALVDENPQRARQSITELSNILRSSLQAEKTETVSLEKELNIVSDYLALEHMRFEERLQIEMKIDPNSLSFSVPPMMIQTLVENAIKHGISKLVNGGKIIIIANVVNNNLILLVQNTGQLNVNMNDDGFGVKSTQDRLNLIYQGKASFEIKNLFDNIVESKVTIPKLI